MNSKAIVLTSLVLALLVAGPVEAFTGAEVPEALVKVVLHVSVDTGSDDNDGALATPFKTIGRAVEAALANKQKGIGTKVLIQPGVYRQSIIAKIKAGDTDAPLVIEAVETGKVIVNGSDVWVGWQRKGEQNIYTHAWPYDWPATTNPWAEGYGVQMGPILLRREMIFADGGHLKQVLHRHSPT